MNIDGESRAQELNDLVEAVRFFGRQGWVPATSSNFSIRLDEDRFAISISGRDKIQFKSEDLMVIDHKMNVLDGEGHRPSAETLIHLKIYDQFDAECVMHTHSVNTTVLSMKDPGSRSLQFHGYEVLKGLNGISTHDHILEVPVFDNSQDMQEFVERCELTPEHRGFLIRGHGLYTWGQTANECKRHIEVFEFLFECRLKELSLR